MTMTREEAIEILEEVKMLDDSVYQYNNMYLQALDMAIKVLAQEPCEDAIRREELLKAIDSWDKFGVDDTNSLFRLDNLSLPHYVPYIHYDDVIKCIKGMPSVTQKSGKWIAQDIHNCHTDFRCSECGYIHSFMHLYGEPTADYTYCPNCGAKMEVKE